jgi:hypothetical protein
MIVSPQRACVFALYRVCFPSGNRHAAHAHWKKIRPPSVEYSKERTRWMNMLE